MRIGVPIEIKNNEFRVAITPAGVAELSRHGHEVLIESDAGLGSAISDDDYAAAGARLVADAGAVWAAADLLLKVKELAHGLSTHRGALLSQQVGDDLGLEFTDPATLLA